jgi:hypothetical protein
VSAEPPAPQGRPRRDLKFGGVHLLLWPTFAFSLKRSRSLADLWRAVPNRRDFFFALSSVASLPPNSETVREPLFYCYSKAPDLTCRMLPTLLARVSEISVQQYAAATRNPQRKLTQREIDIRADMRRAHEDFVAQTTD